VIESQTPPQGPSGGVTEEFRVRGSRLIDKVNEVVAAGNVRKVIVKHDGKVVVEFPLTVGVIGLLLAPQLAALGAIGALVTECSIEIVRQNASSRERPVEREEGEAP
jgi:hypothetical protein